jgi:hypothetical protein
MILGDSDLILGFCTKRFKPQKKFVPTVTTIKSIVKELPCKVQFRHVYRDGNQLADWLANVARKKSETVDLTLHLKEKHPELTPFSSPPWKPKEVQNLGEESRVWEPGELNLVGKNVVGEWNVKGSCNVCMKKCEWVVDKQCWGCAAWFHPGCIGGFDGVVHGPYHCPSCR